MHLLDYSWKGALVFALITTHISVMGTTLYLHRCQAHRALEMHPILSHFFRFWLWMTTGMITKEWAAIHRKHHAHADVEGDPHSPVLEGLPRIFFTGLLYYQRAASDKALLERYGKGTPDDWIERNVYAHNTVGLFITLGIDLLLFGAWGWMVWGLQMIWMPLFACGVINGIGHFWGYRNFECTDAARNIMPIGIICGGEELHNNHHAFGSSAKLSNKWWEFDIGWMYLTIFKALGLVKIKRVAPKVHTDRTALPVDMETLKVLLRHRLQLLDVYYKKVVKPVFKEEFSSAKAAQRALFQKTRRLIVRDASVMCAKQHQRLADLLAQNNRLNTIYEMRQELQSIWSQAKVSREELLEALQAWCAKAEATGIDVLHDFVMHLRTYKLGTLTGSSS